MRRFASPAELPAVVGAHLGYSGWLLVDQERIDAFADVTGDHQWIHVDVERAKAGPFGDTVAHGFLTLSLLPAFLSQIISVDGVRMAVNYGLNKVRFPAPVPSGSRVRGGAELVEVQEVPGGYQVVTRVTVEREGGDKPCCVAELVSRYYV
ncbi:dehydratase [Carbonactinospora thermoautotrophica]|uniref:MaoC family dehydratase n=1 Tax=Carbonactinospora thermoautotrophica TaxID=1469144 RepID=UPI002271B11B|nr:MaoC family dehydratase [Carbonactinospora thermoautotrophica]MCX9193828.1 dehydratase [Carbonactinospora thermoautotrophica]